MKKTERPNVTPAKLQGRETIGEIIRRGRGLHTRNGKIRRYVGDICDFCKRPVYVKRFQLSLRIRGFTFMCSGCIEEKKYTLDMARSEKIIFGADKGMTKLLDFQKEKRI